MALNNFINTFISLKKNYKCSKELFLHFSKDLKHYTVSDVLKPYFKQYDYFIPFLLYTIDPNSNYYLDYHWEDFGFYDESSYSACQIRLNITDNEGKEQDWEIEKLKVTTVFFNKTNNACKTFKMKNLKTGDIKEIECRNYLNKSEEVIEELRNHLSAMQAL